MAGALSKPSLRGKSVHVISDCTHDCFVMRGKFCALPILVVM